MSRRICSPQQTLCTSVSGNKARAHFRQSPTITTQSSAASDFRLKIPLHPAASCSASSLFLPFLLTPKIYTEQNIEYITPQAAHQDAINKPLPTCQPPKAVKIQSHDDNTIKTNSTQFSPSLFSNHLPVDLNSNITASPTSSSFPTTANISSQDLPVFTTDPQSTWLSQPSPSLPAQSEHLPAQDFVLFDSPQPQPHHPNRSASLSSQRRHSSHQSTRRNSQHSPAVQNQRVAQIIKATGHQPSSPTVNANRYGHPFYASSAPSSTISLNQQSRPNRPPVPLFHQSTGSVPTAKMMNAAGSYQDGSSQISHLCLPISPTDVDLDDFTAFEGGANTAFSSPAMPSNFDFSGSASSSTSNLGTVSPHDLLVNEPFMSAPNSSALTALTSPSINESPDFDSYDVSPNFGTADFEGPSADAWYSLFPAAEPNVPEPSVEASPAQQSEDFDMPERSPVSGRRKSGHSPPTSTRHSSVSGVNSRKRDKPLPPIIVENPTDTVAMKRARNTLAARKSRERKAQRLEDLEEQIAKLEAERDHWKNIALAQSGAQN